MAAILFLYGLMYYAVTTTRWHKKRCPQTKTTGLSSAEWSKRCSKCKMWCPHMRTHGLRRIFYRKPSFTYRDKNHSRQYNFNKPQHTGSLLTLEGKGPHSVVAGPVVCGPWLVQIPRRGQNHPEPCFSHPAHFTQVTTISPYLHHWQRAALQHSAMDY